VFTARYGLSPYMRQRSSAFKGSNLSWVQVTSLVHREEIRLMNEENSGFPPTKATH